MPQNDSSTLRKSKSTSDIFLKCLPVIAIIVFFLVIHFCYIFYRHSIFPKQFEHIVPQVFPSFQVAQFEDYTRNLKDMAPRVFMNEHITSCPDIAVTKNQILYCINTDRQIVQLYLRQNHSEVLYEIEEGTVAGLRLSKNEKLLYFTNSNLGLCEFNIKTRKVKTLVDKYQGKFLISLNGIQVHPTDPDLIYFTQSSHTIPMEVFEIDFWLNNPFGRVFQFNKKTEKLSLIAEGLHFSNGIVFSRYKNKDVLVVAESNRNRLIRIYLSGRRKGEKEIALDKLQFYPDNLKAGEKGEILIGSIGFRLTFAKQDEQSIDERSYNARLLIDQTVEDEVFGGMIVKLAENQGEENKMFYLIWASYRNFSGTSTLLMNKGNLYMSTYEDEGVLVIDQIREKVKYKNFEKGEYSSKKRLSVSKFGDSFQYKKFFF